MAEQTVRYRVELDDADLAQQLESIRTRLAEGVASYPGSLLQQQQIPTFDQSQIYTAPLSYTPVSMPEQGNFPTVPVPRELFNTFPNSTLGYQMASDDFENFRKNLSAGFDKFSNSSSNFFNNVVTGSTIPFDTVENFGVKSSKYGVSLLDATVASTGFGYNPRMPIFESDYESFYDKEFSSNAKGMLASGFENAVTFGAPLALEAATAYTFGSTAAAVVGGVGTLAALPVAVGLIGAEKQMEAVESTTENLFNITKFTPVNITKNQAENIATDLYKYTTSDEANLKDLNIEDLNTVIAQFGAAGGYSKTVDVASFTQKTSQLIQNFREFMHALNMAQEDAAALMGELEAKGISSAANAPIFAAQMQVQAGQAGMPTNDLIAYGLQMGDMLKSEGFNPMQGFDFAIDARTEMNRLLNSNNPYYKNAIYQAGGVDAATNNLMKYLGSSSNTSDVLYRYQDYGNTDGGKKDPENVVVADGTEDYFKILDDGAAMFSTDPLSVLKMLSTQKQVSATIGIKQRAQRNVSMAINALESFGYKRDELDPETIVGAMMSQAGGNLDAATAWQTYGLATSFTDYKGLSEQVNQILNNNQVDELNYSTWDVVENAFIGEKSLLGKTNNFLKDMGIDFKKMMKSGAAYFVNGYEDIVDSAIGRKRIHYEDVKDIDPSNFVFENFMGRLLKDNKVANPYTGDVFGNATLITETNLDAIYSKDFRLENNQDNFEKINNAFNFKTIDPLLRRIGIENFISNDGKTFDTSTFNEYTQYANRVMTERDGSIRVADSNTVLQNMGFSAYLQGEGLGRIENYKELATDKSYITFRDEFLKDLNDKSYAPMNFTNGINAENYYDNLSIRRYGKSFSSLNDEEQQNIHVFALDTNGGRKYIKDSGIVQDYEMEMMLPFTPKNDKSLDKFSGNEELIPISSKKGAMISILDNLGLNSEQDAINWLKAFNDPQRIGTTHYKDGVFDATVDIISSKIEGNVEFANEIKKLNEQFEDGNIDITKLTKLYDDYINEWFSGTPTVDIWKASTSEEKAAIIGAAGHAGGGYASDTQDAINTNIAAKNLNNNTVLKLGATNQDGTYTVNTVNMGEKGLAAYIQSLIDSGKTGNVSINGNPGMIKIESGKDGNTIADQLLRGIPTNTQSNFELTLSGDIARNVANSDKETAKVMQEAGMGTYNEQTGVFEFDENYAKYNSLYNSIFSKFKAGDDAIISAATGGGLFALEQDLQGLRSDDVKVVAKHAKNIAQLNSTAMSFDLSTTLAAKFKSNTDEYEKHINTITDGLMENWTTSYKASHQGAEPDGKEIKTAREQLEAQTRSATEGAVARAETIATGMQTTNGILRDILYAVRNSSKGPSSVPGQPINFMACIAHGKVNCSECK